MDNKSNEVAEVVVQSLPCLGTNWVDILSALLVPIIAILGAWIAYQQYKINEQRLRHETYERRLKIYKVVQKYLSEILQDGTSNLQKASQFYAEASEAIFLFDPSMQERIDTIFEKSIDMISSHEKLFPPDGSEGLPKGKERSAESEKNSELLKWHIAELKKSAVICR